MSWNWSYISESGVYTVNFSNLSGNGFRWDTKNKGLNIYGHIVATDFTKNFKADTSGYINGSGQFLFHDTFNYSLWPTRRILSVYVLNTSDETIKSTVCILSSNDAIDTWFTRSFNISGLTPNADYIIGFGRGDAWTEEWEITAAAYLNPVTYSIYRLTGLDSLVNLYTVGDGTYTYLGDVQNIECGEYGQENIRVPNLGQAFPFIGFGAILTRATISYVPQKDNSDWVNENILNYSTLPGVKNIRIWNRSVANQEVIGARVIRSELLLNRHDPLTVSEEYLGVNMSETTNFSDAQMSVASSDTFNADDVETLFVASHDLKALWTSIGLTVNFVAVPSITGVGSGGGEINYVAALYNGFVEFSNQSNIADIVGSSGEIDINISGITRIGFSGALISSVNLIVKGSEIQERRIEWFGMNMISLVDVQLIGTTGTSFTALNGGDNVFLWSRWNCSTSGTATEMRITLSISGTYQARVGLYSDTWPYTILASSDLQSVGGGANAFRLTSSVNITSGTVYRLGIWFNDAGTSWTVSRDTNIASMSLYYKASTSLPTTAGSYDTEYQYPLKISGWYA